MEFDYQNKGLRIKVDLNSCNKITIFIQTLINQMQSQQRGIFKPSLKSHSLLTDPSIKRFSFVESSLRQANNQDFLSTYHNQNESFSYPKLDASIFTSPNYLSNTNPILTKQHIYSPQVIFPGENALSTSTVTKFDPILPKFLFKRFLSDAQLPPTQPKRLNSQIIQPLNIKNINYPFEVQKLFKQAEDKKILYYKTFPTQKDQTMHEQSQKPWTETSYRQSLSQNPLTGFRKIPYFPLIGTDGAIFWSHSVDKIILWKYRNLEFYNPEVFCTLNFERQVAPISAVYATEITSSIFKNQRAILIAVAFFNQLQFFAYNIEKYEKEVVARINGNERSEEEFVKYVEKILVKVNSNFLIEKILIQNIPNHSSPQKSMRPLILFTDGGDEIQIVDLQSLSAYKSHSQYDPFLKRRREKDNKNQNQIIKLLHCRDQINPMIHYAFVLRKQTVEKEIKPQSLLEKIKNLLTFTKKFYKSEEMILSIYEWNQVELKNDTIWKKIWNPPRLKKIKQVTSKDLENKLKQNFFDFFRLNCNSQFLIADVSLVQKERKFNVFQTEERASCSLKVTLINGTSVLISNFRALTLVPQVMVNPYIQKQMPISSCQYQTYRKLLEKGKYLQTSSEIKNKFNFYIYEPMDVQKEPKYSLIDPVLSESNGLTICEDKIIYEDETQILYQFSESNSRKRIHELNLMPGVYKGKTFMIFENSFIRIVETPKIAENLIALGYLYNKYPQNKGKVEEYANSLIEDFSQANRINFIESIIELLTEIQSSGKVMHVHAQQKLVFEQLMRGFHVKENRFDVDETTYLDEKSPSIQQAEQAFAYEYCLNKTDYENFVEYLLGNEIKNKQKQQLKSFGSSYNGKTFKIRVTEKIVEFLRELLVAQGSKRISQKPVKHTASINHLIYKYLQTSLNSQTDGKYLNSLFQGMNEIQESFLTSAISQFILNLIKPILDLSYKRFNRIKSVSLWILQKLEELKDFLDKFIIYSSFKNNKSSTFNQTILFCKSIQNSLPKISLLLKLFETLSQVQFYNPTLQNQQLQNKFNNEITLKNLLFKVNTKDALSRITVENLFEENSLLLDQIEAKIPELNEIKNLRFFKGWKRINSQLVQPSPNDKPTKSSQSIPWIFTWLSLDSKERQNTETKKKILLENEYEQIQDIKQKQKEDFLSIQKSLNEYSYQDIEQYFLTKNQFVDFTNIVLSKIYFLQLNYLEFKNKYHFDEESDQTFNSFAQKAQEKNKFQVEKQIQRGNLSVQRKFNNIAPLSSFLKYEEKVQNYQKYLKTYHLIEFLNTKLTTFSSKVLDLYKIQTEKASNQFLLSTSLTNIKPKLFGQSSLIQNPSIQKMHNFRQSLGKEVQDMVYLLLQKGSDFIRNKLLQNLRISPVLEAFLPKGQNKFISSTKPQQFVDYYQSKNFLVENKSMEAASQDKQLSLLEQSRKNMYQQKMKEKISSQLRGQYEVQNESGWMKNHNEKASFLFRNQKY